MFCVFAHSSCQKFLGWLLGSQLSVNDFMAGAGTPSQEEKYHKVFSFPTSLPPSSLHEQVADRELSSAAGQWCRTISVITTAQLLLQHLELIAIMKQCFMCMVTNAGRHCHGAQWVPCCLLTICTQAPLDQHVTEIMAGPVMGQVVLQPQLCPSTEIMLSISPDWWVQKTVPCWCCHCSRFWHN